LTDQYLKKSAQLRPDNFMHYDFIGNVYFSAERYDEALTYLQRVSFMKPYISHLRAQVVYCSLPSEIRDTQIFGNVFDFNIIFKLSQSFYHDSPNWK